MSRMTDDVMCQTVCLPKVDFNQDCNTARCYNKQSTLRYVQMDET